MQRIAARDRALRLQLPEVDLFSLGAVTPEGARQPGGIGGRHAAGEESIAPFNLCLVGSGRADQGQIEQQQVIDLAIQKALMKNPKFVVQVRQRAAQHGYEAALS